MCCGDKHGFGDGPSNAGVRRLGVGENCGCHEPGHHSVASHHGSGLFGGRETCCCGHPHPSQEERISMLEKYRERLKNELEGVEEELMRLNELTKD
ncbi:MAG: hypothetical protein WCY97_01430 [Methanothrix sp.]|jgi:hypothetical protein|uniref:Uncharacterized protein n=1 Tax=Methanothrix harundinacea TaxID=301375 RepID=A0A101FVB3_9EURY|nr:MAG: hypothetical protein XD72_0473 [Methanothrix harundinacea]MDD2638139.1 hypothetical protein [Methanothrix sp.]MDI9398495.1 hypothetical protein [Euryarchaeota archaeon]KUK97455.1 MAG: hypothetical protein XE07_0285 [Methanothrix harundinacea]MCP1391838.1 hypothetical protein [Methanothrix harundinacea]